MPLDDYLFRSPTADHRHYPWIRDLDPHEVSRFAQEVLDRVEHTPPTPSDYGHLPGDTACALMAVDDHWGVYGAGVLGVDPGDGGANRLELVLDPAWLDRDFRWRRARQPWLLA